MSQYEEWPSTKAKLTSLRLDSRNPRLDFGTADVDEKEILASLVTLEEVNDLARDIARAGYLPTEVLLTVRDGRNQFTVVEGNRRLAALKLLREPDLAPVPKRDTFRRYAQEAEKNGTLPESVKITVAPDRKAARAAILNRHTGSNIKRWSTYAQARYIDQMRQDGADIEQIARQMGGSADDVKRRLRNAQLYESILSLPLEDEIAEKVRDHRKFAFSTLQRLAESTAFRNWTGIAVGKNGKFTFSSKKADLSKALAKIVEHIVVKKITTRTLNSEASIQGYLDELAELKPARKKGSPTALEEVVQANGGGAATPTSGAAGSERRTAREHAVFSSYLKCEVKNRRINALFDELAKLSPIRFKNAWAITFRSLVDMAVQHYFDKRGYTKKLKAKLAAQGDIRKSDWAPSLDRMLKYILEDAQEILDNPQGLKNLRTLVQQRDHWFTMESVNQWVHNRYAPVSVDDLRKVYSLIEPLLEVVLRDQERTPAA